jgi:hypothetical protein
MPTRRRAPAMAVRAVAAAAARNATRQSTSQTLRSTAAEGGPPAHESGHNPLALSGRVPPRLHLVFHGGPDSTWPKTSASVSLTIAGLFSGRNGIGFWTRRNPART